MTLLRTSILSLLATLAKMLSALAINKAVALFIGPAGLALIGQFQNFMQLTFTVAQGAINTGVVKYTAQYGQDPKQLSVLFGTALRISIGSSVAVGLALAFFSDFLAIRVLKSDEYAYLFTLLVLFLILAVINNLLLSILNGLKEIRTWILINIIQSAYSLFYVTALIYFFKLHGALVALVTHQALIFVIVLWMLRRHPILTLKAFKQPFSSAEGKKLLHFAAMAVTSAATVPMAQLVIREYLGRNLGWDSAGYLQAMWYISNIYLTVVTTTLAIYYMPRLSEITDKSELRKELKNGYLLIMPIVTAMAVCIYALRDLIISVLFSAEFIAMRGLFLWQLLGDVIKLAALLLAHLMLAKALTKSYIVTEIAFNVIYVLLSILLISRHGLIGATFAYAITYALYGAALLPITRRVRT